MQFRIWLESKRSDLARLQPDTVVTVFHGTDRDTAYDFCLNGIDAKKQQRYRRFPHVSGGKTIKFGLFVGPDLKTAQKFGDTIVKFKALGKDLIYRYPVESKEKNRTSDWLKDMYPKSFRPYVSWDMLDKGVEPQAIYIGLLSPRAIEKVWNYNYPSNTLPKAEPWTAMTREEFIEYYKSKNPKDHNYKGLFEPQEYKMDLDDILDRLAKEHDQTKEEILDTLKYVYKKAGYLTGVGKLPWSLQKRLENKLKKLI